MPTYDYKCDKCGAVFEISHGFDEKPPKTCIDSNCDGRLHRVFSPPTIIFKGSGWHVTDYGRGNGRNGNGRNGNGKHTADTESPKETVESKD